MTLVVLNSDKLIKVRDLLQSSRNLNWERSTEGFEYWRQVSQNLRALIYSSTGVAQPYHGAGIFSSDWCEVCMHNLQTGLLWANTQQGTQYWVEVVNNLERYLPLTQSTITPTSTRGTFGEWLI